MASTEPPPRPPPHGQNPRPPGGGLPDGNYDIFIVPPHSAGAGFLYLPSLQVQRNSFLAGVACTLLVVGVYSLIMPALKEFLTTVLASGGIGVLLLVVGVGVAGWAWGKTQGESNGGSGFGFGGGSASSNGAGQRQSHQQHQQQQQQQQSQYQQQQQQSSGPNPGPQPNGHPPPPNAHAPPPNPDPKPSAASGWEKAREETRKREEARKREEEMKRRREEAQKAKEDAERAAKAKAEKEKWEQARAREKEQREREARERIAKEREAREKASSKPTNPSSPPKPTYKKPTAHSYDGTEEEMYSARPYDTSPPKRSGHTAHKSSASSIISGLSEGSYAPSHTTARTTPPPSQRGPYSTKDPDKIQIKAVYLFSDAFPLKPLASLISNTGSVTDGLVLRIKTEGLFIDDDVRGVPQREWDVKAWTLKLVEDGMAKTNRGVGLHVLRATARDADAKKFLFVLEESEAWKVAVGLGRLRKGSQVRALGMNGLKEGEVKGLLGGLGWL